VRIPDGYLDPYTAASTYAISILYLAYSFRKIRGLEEANTIAGITATAAFIFVAQMIAWPIPGGTSLHLVGGAISGVLWGPYLGSLAMALVLLVQCLVFRDGGITALGANILNMGIVAVVASYALYRSLLKLLSKGMASSKARFAAGFVAGWISLALAGTVCGIEIGVSGSYFGYGSAALSISLSVMAISHTFLGLVEGAITGSVLAYLGSKGFEIRAER